ncbi:hypothetical protein RTBOTA2_001969 [Rhodotorula toruloides]|nr:hypothetical protein RTBOTA2_001969 [Rhodotorula toruloides]
MKRPNRARNTPMRRTSVVRPSRSERQQKPCGRCECSGEGRGGEGWRVDGAGRSVDV